MGDVWQNSTTIASAPSPGTFMGGGWGQYGYQVYTDAGNLWLKRSADYGQTYPLLKSLAAQTFIDLPFDDTIPCDEKNVIVCYVTDNDVSAAAPKLWLLASRNSGIDWETAVQVDDGATGFSTGNNRFYRHSILLKGSFVPHVWVSTSNANFSTQGLNFRSSNSFGYPGTWTTTALINSGTISSPGRPAMAMWGKRILIVFTDTRSGTTSGNTGETYIVYSDDYGVTWQTEIALTATTQHKTLRPDIAVVGDKVTVVFQDPGSGSTQVLYTIQSTDGGTTWPSSATRLTSLTDGAEHAVFDYADGTLRMYYAYSAGGTGVGTSQIAYQESTDGGTNWGSRVIVNATGNSQPAPIAHNTGRYRIVTYGDGVGVLQSRNYYGKPLTDYLKTIDDFTGADESPLATPNYSVGGLNNPATGTKRVSNTIRRQLASPNFGRDGSYQNVILIPANTDRVILAMDITQMSSNGELDLSIFDPATRNGYYLTIGEASWLGSATGQWTIFRFDAGAVSGQLANLNSNPASGNKGAIAFDGIDVVAYRYSSGSWAEILRLADNTYRIASRIGWEIAGQTDTTVMQADNLAYAIIIADNQPDFSLFPKQTPKSAGYTSF